SRRRHTRFSRDWSSDVCSSDLWVITFPQGTTKPFAPGRRGTAYIIKHCKPIVIPVVIQGFWRAFNKKGLKFKKKGTLLSVTFKRSEERRVGKECINRLGEERGN